MKMLVDCNSGQLVKTKFMARSPTEIFMLSKAVVLVVEDHPLIRLNALDLVSSAGFEGIGVADADEAISILEARPDIHIVFTDVEMPGTMDGLKLAHYIKGRWPKVHLIVASGRAIVQENQMPAGSKFFSKPYVENSIIDEMKRMLAAIDVPLSAESHTK